MYILWRKYPLKDGGFSLRAELVKSYRDEISGNPRNKLVSYLGSIRGNKLNNPVARAYFWLDANTKIARLYITANEKESIRSQIKTRVPMDRFI